MMGESLLDPLRFDPGEAGLPPELAGRSIELFRPFILRLLLFPLLFYIGLELFGRGF